MESVEQPTTEQPETPATEPLAESVSLSDHEATYSREAREEAIGKEETETPPEGETAEQKEARLHHSAEQKREKETGKFAEGKIPSKPARKDLAKPEDVPRIRELASKLKIAETELAELKAKQAA